MLGVAGLGEKIMEEAYGSRYSINSGDTKMYRDLHYIYWWNRMKMDLANFVSRCANFQ